MANHQPKSPTTKNGVSNISEAADRRSVLKKESPFRILFNILKQLEEAKIAHSVTQYRCDSISVLAKLPGERWEIDVMEDGDVDFERFVADGTILEREELDRHIAKWLKIEMEAQQ